MAERPTSHTHSLASHTSHWRSLSLTFLMLSIWTFWLNNFGHFHLSSWHNHRLLALYQISVSLKVFEIYTLSLKKAKLGDNLPDHFYYWGQMKAVVRGLSWWSARGRGGSNQARISAHSPTYPWLTPLHICIAIFCFTLGFHLYLMCKARNRIFVWSFDNIDNEVKNLVKIYLSGKIR